MVSLRTPTPTPAPTPSNAERFRNTAPDGSYSGSGRNASVAAGFIRYAPSVGYQTANSNSKFITMSASVSTSVNTFVSSNDFTLVDLDGRTVAPDSSMYSFDNPFPTLQVQASNRAGGALSFLVTKDFVPAKLIWHGRSETSTVTIVSP